MYRYHICVIFLGWVLVYSSVPEVSQLRIFSKTPMIQFLTSEIELPTLFGFGLLSLIEKLDYESVTEMARESFDFPSGRMTQLARTFAMFRSSWTLLTSCSGFGSTQSNWKWLIKSKKIPLSIPNELKLNKLATLPFPPADSKVIFTWVKWNQIHLTPLTSCHSWIPKSECLVTFPNYLSMY